MSVSRPGVEGRPERQAFTNLGPNLCDVAAADVGRIPSRLERIIQLRIGQAGHQLTPPHDVLHRQPFEDVPMQATEVEDDARTLDLLDQWSPLVVLDLVTCSD